MAMKLEDIEEEHNRSKTPERMMLDPNHGNVKDQRRGSSSLLAAAGIGYEQRRKSSMQTQEGRVFQQGNQVGKPFIFYCWIKFYDMGQSWVYY